MSCSNRLPSMSSAKISAPSEPYTVWTIGPYGITGSVARTKFGATRLNSATPFSSARLASGEACSAMSSSAKATRARFAAAAAERAIIGLNRFPLVVRSARSGPAIACSTAPQSSAVRAIGPSLSSVHESAIAPLRETRPYVGRRPVTPQYADGVPIEPDVSEPIAKGTRPAPTAEPDPLEDPPDQCSVFQGLRPGPCRDALG